MPIQTKRISLPLSCTRDFLFFDVASESDWIAINKSGEIFRNNQKIPVSKPFALEFPRIKIISSDAFLLAEGDPKHGQEIDSWIIDNQGNVLREFCMDGPWKIIVTRDRIVASYDYIKASDTKWGVADIIVFDHSGNCLFIYHANQDKNLPLGVVEIKALLEKDESSIYFMPYTGGSSEQENDFPIVEFSLKDYTTKVLFYATTEDSQKQMGFIFPRAFTEKEGRYYVFEDYYDKINGEEIYRARICQVFPKDQIAEVIRFPSFEMCFQALPKGFFATIPLEGEDIPVQVHFHQLL